MSQRVLVTNDGWNVCYVSGTDIKGYILKVFKYLGEGPEAKFRRGESYGLRFGTMDEAEAHALEHGYLRPYYRRKRHGGE